jgi:hypothetical protein
MMSDMATHGHETDNGTAGAKGAATTAMFLWAVVAIALAYGLVNTFTKVVDLFTG